MSDKPATRTSGPRSSSAAAVGRPDADAVRLRAESATERPRGGLAPVPTPAPRTLACQVFSVTLARERLVLGERVTTFLAQLEAQGCELESKEIRQSSDREYHCLTIVLFFWVPSRRA